MAIEADTPSSMFLEKTTSCSDCTHLVPIWVCISKQIVSDIQVFKALDYLPCYKVPSAAKPLTLDPAGQVGAGAGPR
jgi:hypothetical protein